jgi:hypothetical protein
MFPCHADILFIRAEKPHFPAVKLLYITIELFCLIFKGMPH